jgi:hypothetical protein
MAASATQKLRHDFLPDILARSEAGHPVLSSLHDPDGEIMIFLAVIKLRKTKYMGDTSYETVTRLVKADDDHQAIDKIDAHFERGGPGDDSVSVQDVDLSEMIE